MSVEIEARLRSIESKLCSIERDVEPIKNNYVKKSELEIERSWIRTKLWVIFIIILSIVMQILLGKIP
jgi:hypothetical protein